jgi:VWFA-related protein
VARLLQVFMFAFVLAGSAWAQQPVPPDTNQHAPALIPRTREERERIYQAEHHVVLNVLVTDRSGKPVTGLQQNNFTVLDNGQPRKLSSFRAVEGSKGIAPVRVILMLDAVNNSPKDIAGDRRGVERFLEQNPGGLALPTSVGILSASGTHVGPASRDRDTVHAQLQQITKTVHPFDCGESSGGSEQVFATINVNAGTSISEGERPSDLASCENQRFRKSVDALKQLVVEQESELGRAILIWIGRGWPLLLRHEFSQDSNGIKQNMFDNLVLITNAMREGQVTLDAVFSPDLFRRVELRSDHDNKFFNGVPTENEMTASSLGVQVLAHQSGGLVLLDGKDLAAEVAQCVADAQLYYALSFDTTPASTPGEFHSLEVTTDDPALTVRTNTDYYAEQ